MRAGKPLADILDKIKKEVLDLSQQTAAQKRAEEDDLRATDAANAADARRIADEEDDKNHFAVGGKSSVDDEESLAAKMASLDNSDTETEAGVKGELRNKHFDDNGKKVDYLEFLVRKVFNGNDEKFRDHLGTLLATNDHDILRVADILAKEAEEKKAELGDDAFDFLRKPLVAPTVHHAAPTAIGSPVIPDVEDDLDDEDDDLEDDEVPEEKPEIPEEKPEEAEGEIGGEGCPACINANGESDGKCKKCAGEGFDKNGEECTSCNGNGECRACHGTGDAADYDPDKDDHEELHQLSGDEEDEKASYVDDDDDVRHGGEDFARKVSKHLASQGLCTYCDGDKVVGGKKCPACDGVGTSAAQAEVRVKNGYTVATDPYLKDDEDDDDDYEDDYDDDED